MRSSDLLAVGLVACALASPRVARCQSAQTPAQGYAVERLYLSAPGAGWFVMDALDMHGRLGGAMALTLGYANDPLKVESGGQKLTLVSDFAFADVGLAVTYDRFRLHAGVAAPLVSSGQTGTVGGYAFTGPTADLASTPDSLTDARLGVDVRLLGAHDGPFRLGAGAQLDLPTGKRVEYDSDGTYRAMLRALVAGDVGWFTYAGQLGVHVRPLDDGPTPGSPRGSELLFGAAAGLRVRDERWLHLAVVLGPEIYGASSLSTPFGAATTSLEGLLSVRAEDANVRGINVRVKLGGGVGLATELGAPAWRLVMGLEVFGRTAEPAPKPAR